jgi:hypothetical protein
MSIYGANLILSTPKIVPIIRRTIVCENKANRSVSKKEHLRTTLRVKLKKALVYCDYTIETDSVISDACNVLWDEIEELSTEIKNST